MKRNQLTDPLYYRNRLEEFIRERHPRLIHAYKLIGTRSNLAAQTYKEAIESGESPLAASARADTVLYEDLIFSRSEYNHLIVELTNTLRIYFQQNNIYTPRRGRPANQR